MYWKLIREKVPLLALTAASCVVTYLVQRLGGAVKTLEQFSLRARVANAFVAYVRYIGKMLWPRRLAVHYPHPGDALPLWQVGGAILLLLCVSVLIFRLRRRYPYLGVGWAWYVVTLVPVIGIVQVGVQAVADRYTYVPLVGLFIMIAWGVPDAVARWRYRTIGLAVSAVASLSALMVCTWYQLGHWQDSVALFEHTLNVTSGNTLAHTNLGYTLLQQGKTDEAIGHFSEALVIRPGHVKARTNLGIALARQGRLDEAIAHLSKALALYPDSVDAHYNMAVAMFTQGNNEAAAAHFLEVLRLEPEDADAHLSLGVILTTEGKLAAAASEFQEVLRLRPDHDKAREYLDKVRQAQQKRQNES